jgi:hypothetical protein
MAENQVQIEVELVGQKEVDKGLESITKGAEGVGETFKSVGNVVGKTNQQLGEGLSSVSDALGETMGAVSGVKDAFVTLGQGGALSFTSLVGPISLVVTAVGAVYEAYRQLSGAAKEAEQDAEAMAAAANDLQSKLEALAEGGVILTADALKTFTRATIDAQVAKEKLIFAYEKLTTAYRNEQKAQAESQQLQQRLNELMKDSVAAGAELISVGAALARARQRETTATNALNQSLEQLQKQQEQVSLALAAAGKMQKQAEENTYDAVIAKVKELNERKKALDIMEAEASAFDDEIKALKKLAAEEDARARAKQISVAEDALNLEALKALRDELDRQVSSIEADVEAQSAQAKATQIVTDALKKQTEARKASAAAGKAAAAAALAAEQQRLTMQSQINLLDIQLTKEGEAQKLALIEERHRAGLEIAKDDSMKRAVVDKAYQLELKKLQDERTAAERVAAEERLKIEREARQQAIAFEVESQQFAIEHRIIPKDDLAAENQQRLDALGVRYAQEFILAQDNEVKLAEMQRRFAMERAQIEQEFIDLRLEKVNSALDQYGKGFAQAAAAAIWTSKSIGEAFKGVLQGLAQEATVSALMETAKGFAALILNPAAAGNHFAAAGIFGAAAVAAGGAAAAIPTAGAGGKNTATPTSPTGTPQTSTAPQRERAEASQIVYNVNFGGAVVYDTKRAAEMAMTQRLDRRRGEMRGAR